MLTDLSFLNVGEEFPPKSEHERLERYERNKLIFESRHDKVYERQFERIQRVIGNFQNVISYAVVANYQKLISLKIADLLLGEKPIIKAGEEDSTEQGTVNLIEEKTDLHNTAYEVAIDVSRYGNGLFYIYKSKDGKGTIDVTQPYIWFPIVSPDNIKETIYHVLAWRYEADGQTYLKVQVHDKGKYDETVYQLETGLKDTIKKVAVGNKTVFTYLSDFAIVPVANILTSDRVFGMDDYDDIDSIISEIEVRISQIAKILDKHAEPSMQGPSSSLSQNPQTGEWSLKTANFFAKDSKEDADVSYVTWDAQLDANFKMIEKLINILYTVSEMGSALLGDASERHGNVISGSALKRLMISPLAKINRIKMRFDPALKKAIKLCSELGGENIVNLDNTAISITWNNGLPTDPLEEANVMNIRTGQKPTLSQYTAIKTMDNLSDADTIAELDRIKEDEASLNPMNGLNTPFSNADNSNNNNNNNDNNNNDNNNNNAGNEPWMKN